MEKQYVSVNVDYTPEGKILPRSLTWIDGETYKINRVKQIRPFFASKDNSRSDRYTIVVNGRESYLYFERNMDYGDESIGRWYVEISDSYEN